MVVADLVLQLSLIHLVGDLADLGNVAVREFPVTLNPIHFLQGEGGLLPSQHVVRVHHQEGV